MKAYMEATEAGGSDGRKCGSERQRVWKRRKRSEVKKASMNVMMNITVDKSKT